MDHLRFKSDQTAAAYVADGLEPETREQFELHLMSCPECVEDVESWRAIKSCLPADARSASGSAAAVGTAVAGAAPSGALNIAASSAAASGIAVSGIAAPSAASPSRSAPPKAPAAQPSRPSVAPAAPARTAGMSAAARWRLAAALVAGVIAGTAGGWYGRSAQGPSLAGDNIGFYSLPPLMRGPADCTAVRVGPQVDLIALRVPAATKEQQLVAVDSEGHDLAPDQYAVRMQPDGSWLVRLRAQAVRDQGIRFEARSADGTVEPRGCVLNGSQT